MVIAAEIEKVIIIGDTIVELTDKVQISAGGENSANLISTAI
jgi:hypothetical protein